MITEFYKDKTILLTGCTGFLGTYFTCLDHNRQSDTRENDQKHATDQKDLCWHYPEGKHDVVDLTGQQEFGVCSIQERSERVLDIRPPPSPARRQGFQSHDQALG